MITLNLKKQQKLFGQVYIYIYTIFTKKHNCQVFDLHAGKPQKIALVSIDIGYSFVQTVSSRSIEDDLLINEAVYKKSIKRETSRSLLNEVNGVCFASFPFFSS